MTGSSDQTSQGGDRLSDGSRSEEKADLKSKDVADSRHATKDQLQSVEEARTNRSDGSLGQYGDLPRAVDPAHKQSIQIIAYHDGEEIAIGRQNQLREKQLDSMGAAQAGVSPPSIELPSHAQGFGGQGVSETSTEAGSLPKPAPRVQKIEIKAPSPIPAGELFPSQQVFRPVPKPIEVRQLPAPSPIIDRTNSLVKDTSDRQPEPVSELSRLKLEEAKKRLVADAGKHILDEVERQQFIKDVQLFEDSYLKRSVKAPDAAYSEIANAMNEVANVLENESSILSDDKLKSVQKRTADTPFRIRLAEEILRHCADPTSIDQGKLPVCQVESLQMRTYWREPASAAKLVSETFLTGVFSAHGKPLNVAGLSGNLGDILMPDDETLEFTAYKADSSPRRGYASKIFDITSINIGLEKNHKAAKYIEDEFSAYLIMNDGKRKYIADSKDPKKTRTTINEIGTDDMVNIYQAVTGTNEKDFIITGAIRDKYGRHLSPSLNAAMEMTLIDSPSRDILGEKDLAKAMLGVKDDGLWPPILLVKSIMEPIRSEWIAAGFDPDKLTKDGTHFVVTPEMSANGCSIDNMWSKRSDHPKPDIAFELLGKNVMESGPQWDLVDTTLPDNYKYTDPHDASKNIDNTSLKTLRILQKQIEGPDFQEYFKKWWLQEFADIARSNPGNAWNDYFAKHPNDSIAKRWHAAYPEDVDGTAFRKRMQEFFNKYHYGK